MGNTIGSGYQWLSSTPLVNPQTGVATPQFQQWLALVLAQVITAGGTLTSGVTIDGQGSSIGSSLTALQAQAINLSSEGIIQPAGVDGSSVSGINGDDIASGSSHQWLLNILEGMAQTGSITGGAVSEPTTFMLTAATLVYAQWVTVGTIEITPVGGFIEIQFDGTIANTSANNVTVSVAVFQGSTQMGSPVIVQVPFESSGEYASYSFTRFYSPAGDAELTFTLQMYLQLDVSNPVSSYNGEINAINLKV